MGAPTGSPAMHARPLALALAAALLLGASAAPASAAVGCRTLDVPESAYEVHACARDDDGDGVADRVLVTAPFARADEGASVDPASGDVALRHGVSVPLHAQGLTVSASGTRSASYDAAVVAVPIPFVVGVASRGSAEDRSGDGVPETVEARPAYLFWGILWVDFSCSPVPCLVVMCLVCLDLAAASAGDGSGDGVPDRVSAEATVARAAVRDADGDGRPDEAVVGGPAPVGTLVVPLPG